MSSNHHPTSGLASHTSAGFKQEFSESQLELIDAGVIMGIETSCDETAVAILAGTDVVASVIQSQVDIHASFGGVVPELAARAHDQAILATIEAALAEAKLNLGDLDAIAVTNGPGLPGALMVGVGSAQGLALGAHLPLYPVDHMEGHLFAAALEGPVALPALVLLVSGGHTEMIAVDAPGSYRLVGRTKDDAAGEAFDKVARLLDLGYPGGPAIERAVRDAPPPAIDFPRGLRSEGLDFSFSGLKTAVMSFVRTHPEVGVTEIAAAFQVAAIDALVIKVERALSLDSYASVVIGGGVAANELLRTRIGQVAAGHGVIAAIPAKRYCTDNGAMIAAAAAFHRSIGDMGVVCIDADPQRTLIDLA
ncbi:tRNA (adenosine(37)-N6)-threonylcarbamoyltransferase complex transferase subunit TsaD [Ferrimicrobium acidiphilum]|uniref:tRNA (adenosine(37)-N6)-threonylcarbamoyltransferase complex transferase subunit TsaD n=1 Tax=Ferrimicrobium acidiphilum TaxID=121039 RepID=UPI0023F56BA4|nr:tRNA (adenosine(37)-N6)-threonylcarbamoyltransferase complex transferase subunit TsaD [Ferrimicrobium acidiphilum]